MCLFTTFPDLLDGFLQAKGGVDRTEQKPLCSGFRGRAEDWSLARMTFSKSLEMLERREIPRLLDGSVWSFFGIFRYWCNVTELEDCRDMASGDYGIE